MGFRSYEHAERSRRDRHRVGPVLTILVTTVGWPRFLEIQRASLDRFLAGDYRLVAVVDTPTASTGINLWGAESRADVISGARGFADEVIPMPEELHSSHAPRLRDRFRRTALHPSARHAQTLDYAWSRLLETGVGPVLILDADMILVAPHEGVGALGETFFHAVRQSRDTHGSARRIDYVWPGLVLADLSRMPETHGFRFGVRSVDGAHLDTGGETSHWLEALSANEAAKVRWIDHLPSLTWTPDDAGINLDPRVSGFLRVDDRNENGKVFAELYDRRWLHFRAGSNWRNEPAGLVLGRRAAFESSLLG